MERPNFKNFAKFSADMTHFDILIFQFPFWIPTKDIPSKQHNLGQVR